MGDLACRLLLWRVWRILIMADIPTNQATNMDSAYAALTALPILMQVILWIIVPIVVDRHVPIAENTTIARLFV